MLAGREDSREGRVWYPVRMDLANLLERARAWADNDPDPEARAELLALTSSADPMTTDLPDRFAGALEFGTAGLRGVLGAGPNRMNLAVVLRTTYGLARYLMATSPGSAAKGVVIGFDGRRMSRIFAEDTACALAGMGVKAFLFANEVPTPLLAFAVSHLGCAAGVMITASHNPAEYNGYKAYWSNGAQIIPPTDVGIAEAIASAPVAKLVPRRPFEEAKAAGLVAVLQGEVFGPYLAGIKNLALRTDGDRSLSIVYTPMHGVGDELARRAFAEAGFAHVTSVPEQQKPDGRFPTVAFPNPEEKGAMDLAFAVARSLKADLVVANDPDADRLAVALPSGESPSGYVQLTGNQVGVLLGHYVLTGGLEHLDRVPPHSSGEQTLVLASIVSSPMLGSIAVSLGAHYEEVLTGFKWIANRAMDLKRENYRFAFGFEEALGYSVGELVRDKDGISAAVIFAELVAVLRARGTTVLAHLENLYRRYGLYVSSQVSLTRKGVEGMAELRALMANLRQSPPWSLDGFDVVAVRDYHAQVVRHKDGGSTPLSLPKSDVLVFDLASGNRVIARPSGTEPKAKFYVDVRERIADGETLAAANARAATLMKTLSDAVLAVATKKS